MKDEDLTGGQWRSTGSWWPGKKFSCQSGLYLTLFFSFYFRKIEAKQNKSHRMQNTSTSRSTDFRRQKTITSKTPLTLYGRGFCASDGTPTTTGSPAGPQSNQNVWVLPPISRNACRLWIIKSGNELFWAKKGRSHQWSFCAWRRKRWLHFETSKNQTNGRIACWVSRSLKPPCHGDRPTRSWSAHVTSALRRQRDHAGYCEYAPYARQASTKRESNGSDVQWRWAHPKMPPDWGFAE